MLDRRALRRWADVVQRVVLDGSEKLEFIIPPPTAGVFTSRDTDNINRSRYLKRLSFVIYSCPKNTFISELATIVETLVENLRLPKADYLHSQVLLCMRVLLLRISPPSLIAVWPILLAELINVLTAAVAPAEGATLPSPQYVLAALKVVDLASLLDLPDFHLYQWMFITDLLKGDSYAASLCPPPTAESSSVGGSTDGANPRPDPAAAAPSPEFQPFTRMITKVFGRRPSGAATGDGSASAPNPSEAPNAVTAAAGPPSGNSAESAGGRPTGPCPPTLLRGPLIKLRRVHNFATLSDVAAALDEHFVNTVIARHGIDYNGITWCIESDILESPDGVLDWGFDLDLQNIFSVLACMYRRPAHNSQDSRS